MFVLYYRMIHCIIYPLCACIYTYINPHFTTVAYSYYYHYFIYLSSTILYYANHVTLSVRRHSSIELWRMRLVSVSK